MHLVSSSGFIPPQRTSEKIPSDISDDQFEYLCAAYLENDLSESQKTELQEIINIYPDRKRTFDLIQKTILPLSDISHKHKSRLLRQTPLQNVIRLSAIGLSAAAAVTIIIILYSVIPGTASLKQINTAHNFMPDSTIQRPSQIMAVVSKAHILPPAPQRGYKKIPAMSKSPLGDLRVDYSGKAYKTASSNDSSLRIIDKQMEAVIKVPVNPEVDLRKGIVTNTLIASNPTINFPYVDDERSRVGKFISRTFREKILKEKTPPELH